ncbi:shufflon system plasmid conjugative transfer pilus tip adhesin PilV [Plesiomonas shigelloides subsp. oncorhynchi]|nr:shufflon system plasmid conjugative transfer pilus tip adhesin PilV [Plesiomonas shigelloides]MDA1379165.1 shufflon system plasmid conjugative transfer pilus tip adhesin PilV [Plesiomonas shigelloides]
MASQGSVTAGGDVSSSGAVTANSDIRTNSGWLITQGNQGWRNATHNGGWYMSDSTWLRSYLDKNIYTGGQVLAGSVSSNGRLRTGEYLLIEGIAVAGQNCSPNGLEGRDITGAPLICQSGVWQSSGGKSTNISIYQCPYSICDNNSASTCSGQLSTQSTCQCRAGGWQIACPYVGKLVVQ